MEGVAFGSELLTVRSPVFRSESVLDDPFDVGRTETHHPANSNDWNPRRFPRCMVAHPTGRYAEQTGDFRWADER